MINRTIITESERLLICLPDIKDAEDSFAVYGDPEVMKFIDKTHPFRSIDEAKENIKRGLAYYEKHRVCHWAVVEKESKQMIGHAGFNLFEQSGDLELVIHLNKNYWDKGYATEAGQACVAYAICELGTNKIVALTEEENTASQKVIKSIGFSLLGERVFDDRPLLYFELKSSGGIN